MTLGSGCSLGPEGPCVELGAATGQWAASQGGKPNALAAAGVAATPAAWKAYDVAQLYDDITRRRMQQPARHKGGGERSRHQVCGFGFSDAGDAGDADFGFGFGFGPDDR